MRWCPGWSLVSGALGAALLSSCGAGAPPVLRPVVVTQVPAGTAPTWVPEPAERYPEGSRLVLLDLDDPAAEPRVLSEGLAAAGGASVAADGRHLLFVGREAEGEPFAVWTAALDGSNRRKAADPGSDCGAAAFLPDGRIVFSARLPGPPPAEGLTSPWALFVVPAEGGEPLRITYGLSELDPAVLADGRIVHAQWQPGGDGRPAAGSFSVFTVHPDGAGAAPVHGQHGGPSWKLLPRQGSNGDVFFLAAEPGAPAVIRAADWRAPAASGYRVALASGAPLAVEPAADGRLLVATAPAPGWDGGLLSIEPDGQVVEEVMGGDAAWRIVHAVEAAPRPRPQGQLSLVDPAGDRGSLLCLDARPPGQPNAARVRLKRAATSGRAAAVLGEVALAEDGSFFATVPANLPLLLDLLDADGRTLMETTTPIWVRPKEVRGCIGCHEDPETAPPNRRPLAVLGEAVDLVGEPPPEVSG